MTTGPGRRKYSASMSSDDSRLSTAYLTQILEELRGQKHRSSTKKMYYGVWKHLNKFLLRLDHIPPVWEDRVALYCAYLIHECGRKSTTVRSYLSAIKSVLIDDGYNWCKNKLLLSSITKACKKEYDVLRDRRPIQISILELLLMQIERKFQQENQTYLESIFKTAFAVAYYGLFRIGEITMSNHTVKAADVHEDRNHKKFLFLLRSSKTHSKADRPQKIKIESASTDRAVGKFANRIFCPVELIREYLNLRGPYQDESEQFFVFSDGSPLKPCHFRDLLKKLLRNLDLDPDLYDTHSFRIGRATDLLKLGYSVESIQKMGRWSSDAVFDYLRD